MGLLTISEKLQAPLINRMGLIKRRNWMNFLKNLPQGIPHKIKQQIFLHKSRKEQFEVVYKAGGFGSSPSLSGVGSNFENTENIRVELPKLVNKYRITTILDIPCGDLYWMRHVDLGSINYTGADIIEELVRINEQKYGSGTKSFQVLDIVEDKLPCVDLVICRDCLIHLKLKDILSALASIKKSGSKYLLVSTYPQSKANSELGEQFWRPINLQIKPFALGDPLEIIHDGPVERKEEEPYKCIALWKVNDLPDVK